MFFQQFSGINAFIYYAPTLFTNLGQTPSLALIMSGIFNILQLVAVSICFAIIDKVGRRPLAIFGSIGETTCYLIMTALSGLYSSNWPSHQNAGWATAAVVLHFILIYGVSYSLLGWALPAEVFTTTTRSKGVALSVCVCWLSNFVVAIAIPPMLEKSGCRTYVFFSVMCALASVWAVLIVSETKRKSLREIDDIFGDVQGGEEQQLMRQVMVSVSGHDQEPV